MASHIAGLGEAIAIADDGDAPAIAIPLAAACEKRESLEVRADSVPDHTFAVLEFRVELRERGITERDPKERTVAQVRVPRAIGEVLHIGFALAGAGDAGEVTPVVLERLELLCFLRGRLGRRGGLGRFLSVRGVGSGGGLRLLG